MTKRITTKVKERERRNEMIVSDYLSEVPNFTHLKEVYDHLAKRYGIKPLTIIRVLRAAGVSGVSHLMKSFDLLQK